MSFPQVRNGVLYQLTPAPLASLFVQSECFSKLMGLYLDKNWKQEEEKEVGKTLLTNVSAVLAASDYSLLANTPTSTSLRQIYDAAPLLSLDLMTIVFQFYGRLTSDGKSRQSR